MIYTQKMIKEKLDRKQKVKKILEILYIPIILIILIGAFSLLYQRYVKKVNNAELLGYRSFIVLTGSMEPNIKIGDIVLIKKVDQTDLKIGDVITYSFDSNHSVTHRIIEIVEKEGEIYYKTKGDNNNSSDSELVPYKNVLGTVKMRIPKLGSLLNVFIASGGIVFVLFIILISWSHSSKKNDRILAREECRKKYNVCKYKK